MMFLVSCINKGLVYISATLAHSAHPNSALFASHHIGASKARTQASTSQQHNFEHVTSLFCNMAPRA